MSDETKEPVRGVEVQFLTAMAGEHTYALGERTVLPKRRAEDWIRAGIVAKVEAGQLQLTRAKSGFRSEAEKR